MDTHWPGGVVCPVSVPPAQKRWNYHCTTHERFDDWWASYRMLHPLLGMFYIENTIHRPPDPGGMGPLRLFGFSATSSSFQYHILVV